MLLYGSDPLWGDPLPLRSVPTTGGGSHLNGTPSPPSPTLPAFIHSTNEKRGSPMGLVPPRSSNRRQVTNKTRMIPPRRHV